MFKFAPNNQTNLRQTTKFYKKTLSFSHDLFLTRSGDEDLIFTGKTLSLSKEIAIFAIETIFQWK